MNTLTLPRFFSALLDLLEKPKHKTYDYTQSISGIDYVFEPVDNLTKGYITAQLTGILPGDYIILRDGCNLHRYQIEDIEYYSEPPDMWIATTKEACC